MNALVLLRNALYYRKLNCFNGSILNDLVLFCYKMKQQVDVAKVCHKLWKYKRHTSKCDKWYKLLCLEISHSIKSIIGQIINPEWFRWNIKEWACEQEQHKFDNHTSMDG